MTRRRLPLDWADLAIGVVLGWGLAMILIYAWDWWIP